MTDEIKTKILKIASQVFETMCFTPIEVQQEDGKKPEEGLRPFSAFYRGEIGFEGNESGRLVVSIPVGLAQTMASNFLGLDEPLVTHSQVIDMVNELCNVVCGNLFSMMDKKTVWKLTIPQTLEVKGGTFENNPEDHALAVHFYAEGYPVHIQIRYAPPG